MNTNGAMPLFALVYRISPFRMAGTAFLLMILLPVLSLANGVNLPRTGQGQSYDHQGAACLPGASHCPSGQDGAIRAGIRWPSTRFIDNGDGTVTDSLTGLMWLKDANCFGKKKWVDALWAAIDFNGNVNPYKCDEYAANYTDWRVPNVNELESLLTYLGTGWVFQLAPFTDLFDDYYWSSTTFVPNPAKKWIVPLSGGTITSAYGGGAVPDSLNPRYPVLLVRGKTKGPARVSFTGQLKCYDMSGNEKNCNSSFMSMTDGAVRAGESWGFPRFIDHQDGTVTDYHTGLMWLKDCNCLKTNYPSADNEGIAGDGRVTWEKALNFVQGVNKGTYPKCQAGYSDWRVPNLRELYSLLDFQEEDPAIVAVNPFQIPGGPSSPYWSSSVRTPTYGARYVWSIDLNTGEADDYHSSQGFNYVWMVRCSTPVSGVRYVSPSGEDTGCCCDPAAPCRTIEYAVERAREARQPCTIRVAQGTYCESVFVDTSVPGLEIQGGWTDDFSIKSNDASLTVVNVGCGGEESPFTLGSTDVPAVTDIDLSISGLTLTNGTGSGLNAETPYGVIGALNLTLKNNLISGNAAGGIALQTNYNSSTELIMEDNAVLNNESTGNGGGLYIHALDDTAVDISGNLFQDNIAVDNGGGIYFLSQSADLTGVVDANIIKKNGAQQSGGGVYIASSGPRGYITLANNMIVLNLSYNGAGISVNAVNDGSALLKCLNNTIAYNWALVDGGGLYAASSYRARNILTVINCILWGNLSGNSLTRDLYLSEDDHAGDSMTSVTASYSDVGIKAIQNGTYIEGSGNMDQDPLFANTGKEDFHLTQSSPARKAGICGTIVFDPISRNFKYTRIAPYEDFEGDPRPGVGELYGCDVGADEYVFGGAVIERLKPSKCNPKTVVTVYGQGFGTLQTGSSVHIGSKKYDSAHSRVKKWKDNRIKVKLPNYACRWFKGANYRKQKVWVTVEGMNSNKKKLKILRPSNCR